jgi:hypothetical protein
LFEPLKLVAFELMIFTGVVATPFIVVVKLFTVDVFDAELIILTGVAAIPFTVVVKLFTADVFATVDTEFDVAAMPFTVLVKVFPDNANVFVVAPVNCPTEIRRTIPAFEVKILSVSAPDCKPFKRNGFVP